MTDTMIIAHLNCLNGDPENVTDAGVVRVYRNAPGCAEIQLRFLGKPQSTKTWRKSKVNKAILLNASLSKTELETLRTAITEAIEDI